MSKRLFKSPIDIYYSFVSADFVHSTQLLKLTAWHPEQSAYKILSIPPPPSTLLQYSREWRIMLSCPHPKVGTETAQLNSCGFVSLDDDEIGVVPFPVFSLPIRLETAGPSVSGAPSQKTGGKPSKGKSKSVGSTKVQKQEGVQRVLVMERPLLRNEHIEHTDGEEGDKRAAQHRILISEKTSFDLDKKIWDSGLGLSAWLARKLASHISIPNEGWNIPADPVCRVIAKLSQSRCRVLELGTGSGLVSLTLACALSGQSTGVSLESTPGPAILATDLPSAVELIEQNLDANQRIWEGVDVKAGVLDWDDHELPKEVIDAPPDVLVMADVTYNTSSFPSLLRTIDSILRLAPGCEVILAYKERHETERGIWGGFEGIGLEMRKIDQVYGFGGAQVEIWLGGVDRLSHEK